MTELAIRFSGSGGQGLITAGIIFSMASSYAGYNVSQTQSYGPEARGGASRTDVIISDDEIAYPKPAKLDILLALTQESVDKYFRHLKGEGTLIVNSTLVGTLPTSTGVSIPFTSLAREQIGNVLTANIISLGAMLPFLDSFPINQVEKALKERFKKALRVINIKALKLGLEEGKEALAVFSRSKDVFPAEELEG